MILKPAIDDVKIIGYYLGKITKGIGLFMLIPLAIAVFNLEWQPAMDFLFGISVTLLLGHFLCMLFYTKKDLDTVHAMAVASLSWVVAMFVSAIPLVLSGHYASVLDALFESMSGYATTGLTLVRDLDHMSFACNFWRHEMMFIGGQGIVVMALTFLFRGTAGAFRMYLGEAREERILPNVVATARFIWLVSLTYLILGSAVLFAANMLSGFRPWQALFDSVCIFMAAWDTGGFAPHSQNILFYHSFPFEAITCVIMLLGSMNFALHYALWTGNRKEAFRNIEVITFSISFAVALSVAVLGILKTGLYCNLGSFFRKSFYQLISAHTGTGYSTMYPAQFTKTWGQLGMLGTALAMAIGGSVCSTTGAIKVLRIGIMYKAFRQSIKKLILPESAVMVQKLHHVRDIILEDRHVRAASFVILAYLLLYLFGTVAGMLCGYSLSDSGFESISAAANVGLSSGITRPSMPDGLKVVYILQMWAGRLEFVSIFVLIGLIVAAIKGKK
ncbi:TrkH family potassium uptake protein [Candidatus Omnitrophota bacterium]